MKHRGVILLVEDKDSLRAMLRHALEAQGHSVVEARDLGTDIYNGDKRHFGRSPFAPNAAMIFVPADNTFHGFEKRPIQGVRTSLIINYVTNDWRAREQLFFPETPIA